MEFLKNLLDKVGSIMYKRGEEYYKKGKILKLQIESVEEEYYGEGVRNLTGTIKGSSGYLNYRTDVIFNYKEVVDYNCSCMYFRENMSPCKHIAAVGMAAYNLVLKKEGGSKVLADEHLDFFKNPTSEKTNPIFLKITPEMEIIIGHKILTFDMQIVLKDKKYKLTNKFSKFLEASENE